MITDPTLEALKAADPDRSRAAMLADKAGRERLLVIYAFHHELAKVPEIVSEPMLGEIRYQWWRDTIDEVYSGGIVRKHEVSTPLAGILREQDIPRFWADRLIDGRARDLDPTPFSDVNAAKQYCRQTSGVLMQIAARCLSDDVDDEAVLLAGEAWGLTGLARAWRYYHRAMLSKLSYEDICEAARAGHIKASKSLNNLPSNAFPAVAYTALIPKYIAKLTAPGHNPVTDSVAYGPLSKRFRLLGAAMRGKI